MKDIGTAKLSKNRPIIGDYTKLITIGVGNLSSVRLWFWENEVVEKTRPKYIPLEWKETERLESTAMIKWFIVVGIKNNENKVEIQMEETSYSNPENLSVTSA